MVQNGKRTGLNLFRNFMNEEQKAGNLNKIISIILGSKIIIASLVMLVFVTGFSLGYQVCLYYTVGHSALFGNSPLTNSVNEYNATFKGDEDEK
jgi:hypothetical protein